MTNRDPALHILQHALGLDYYGRGNAHRNHFVASPDTEDWTICTAHVEAGRMVRHEPRELFGGYDCYCFVVTDAGRRYVREHSPQPPKLTRSQLRYRKYLAQDSGLSFGEWLRSDWTIA